MFTKFFTHTATRVFTLQHLSPLDESSTRLNKVVVIMIVEELIISQRTFIVVINIIFLKYRENLNILD